MVGYCYSGSVAYALACRSDEFSDVSSYYGKLAPDLAEEPPHCPVICHFGKTDNSIPLERIDHLKQMRPGWRAITCWNSSAPTAPKANPGA